MGMSNWKVGIEWDGTLSLGDGLIMLSLKEIVQSQHDMHRSTFIIQGEGLKGKFMRTFERISRGCTPPVSRSCGMGRAQPHISKHIAGVEFYRSFQELSSLDVILLIKFVQKVVSPDPVTPGLKVVCRFRIGAGLLSMR